MPGGPEYPVLGGVEYNHPLLPPTSSVPAAGIPGDIHVAFAGTSSLAASRSELHRFTLTLAGTSSLAVASILTRGRVSQVATEVLSQKAGNALVSQVATEVLIQTHQNALVSQVATEVLLRNTLINATFAGTSSFSANVTSSGGGVYRLFTVSFVGYGQLLFPGLGPISIAPVVFAGTSSLTVSIAPRFSFRIAGRSSLSVTLHRAQFIFQIHGSSSLTFPFDFGPPGGRLSQVTAEVARGFNGPDTSLSQVTLEVLRPRTGLHVWQRF